jgi:hypothetical protein
MPRKRVKQVETELESLLIARIRYLLRNPSFQREFNDLRTAISTTNDLVQQLAALGQFEDRWGVYSLIKHPKLFQRPDGLLLSISTIPHFEKILTSDVRSGRLIGEVSSFREQDILCICIDMTTQLAVDSVLALVEDEIRQNYPKRHGRKRFDTVEFHLSVFDLAIQRKTFAEISSELDSPISTIKSAFRVCTRKIFGESKSKKDKTIHGHDMTSPTTHLEHCDVCKKASVTAKSLNDYCPEFQAYVDQDYVPQREKTGYDTTEEAFRKHK